MSLGLHEEQAPTPAHQSARSEPLTILDQTKVPFWDRPLVDLRAALNSTAAGLSTDEAERRLDAEGPNELSVHGHRALVEFLLFFANPLVLILLFAAAVSGVVGEFLNAALIVVMVMLSVALNFFQTYRSQRAADSLRRSVSTTASILRDGSWRDVPRREVVPGDVVRVAAGDLVPADVRLIDARDLFVNEAALTGESLPAEKTMSSASGPRGLADADTALFLGTSVISGTATALVIETGARTQIGHVAQHLTKRPPPTEFERGTHGFGMLIMRTVVFLVLFVFVVNAGIKHASVIDSLLFAIALAVGLTPEFLPMIMSVTLSAGAVRMARHKVIVKRLSSIENFGSMNVLCSDKTGTLTEGCITLEQYVDTTGTRQERVLLFAVLNGAFESGIKSPLDEAIVRHSHPDIAGYNKRDEIPFDFSRRRSSVVVEDTHGPLLVAKGAPESILPVCTRYERNGQALPLDTAARVPAETTFRTLSADGYRVLAVAYRPVPSQSAYAVADEQGLILAGFAAFLDPPRRDVADTIATLRRDGITVKIMTGDNELVTASICRQVGLDPATMVLGTDLEQISEEALGPLAERAAVFARVSPDQKNRVMRALQRRGHVVGFMGDGINDAPSLHSADVGISVANAVDVAKDAADIILLERSLSVLHAGLLEGRKCFGNIMKYIMMGTSSNFGNMFSMAGAVVFLPYLPMLPLQILINNFLYDLSQLTIPGDRVDDAYMENPKRWNIHFIQRFMLIVGPVSSLYDFLTFGAMIWLFHSSEKLFHTGWFVESLATQTLVILVIRTALPPWKSRPSTPLMASVLTSVGVGVLLPFTPVGASLGFTPLPAGFFLFLLVVVTSYLGLVEGIKRWFYQRYAQ